MHVIPVIDVRHGRAVHAVAGDRANYHPLVTPLVRAGCASSWGQTHGSAPEMSGQRGLAAIAVAHGYRTLYAFDTIYVADLDGIEGRGADAGTRTALAAEFPAVEFWFDTGATDDARVANTLNVVGSESLSGGHLKGPMPADAILSLDFKGEAFVGPASLLRRPDLWPSRVIVMTLGRVGTNTGPDIGRITEIAALAPHARIYAAGGIRDVADLHAAREAGAYGALVASALHAQTIKADDLREIVGP